MNSSVPAEPLTVIRNRPQQLNGASRRWNIGSTFDFPALRLTIFNSRPGKVILGFIIPGLLICLGGCRQSPPDELVMVLDQDIPTFDPRVSSDPVAERLRELLFNGLTRINEQSQPVPDLAADIEASADHRTFTFHLKKGVKFHNDRPLSSLDVKYTFETMLAPGFVSDKKARLLHSRLEIEAIDPATVVFRCREPFPDFLKAVAPIGIIPEGTTAQQSTQPIGTGPYRLISVKKGTEFILTAHRDYFAGPPSTEKLRIKIGPAQ